MDIAKLKSYYVKPNVNKYSIDFILGYKNDQSKAERQSEETIEESNTETEDIIDVESTEKDRDTRQENEQGKASLKMSGRKFQHNSRNFFHKLVSDLFLHQCTKWLIVLNSWKRYRPYFFGACSNLCLGHPPRCEMFSVVSYF